MSALPVKGIRLRVINLVMIIVSLALFLFILYSTVQISRDYNATITAMNNYMEWENATRSIQFGTDYLTEQAKFYASTLNKRYADNYFRELYSIKSRERALDILTANNLHSHDDSHDCELKRAVALSNALSQTEIYAIRLVAEATHQDLLAFPPIIQKVRLSGQDRVLSGQGKIERARGMLFNLEYQKSKKEIFDLLTSFLHNNTSALREAEKTQSINLGEALASQRIFIIAIFILNVLIFLMIISLVIRPLKIYLECIKEDRKLKVTGSYEFRQLAETYNEIFALKEYHDKMLKHKAEHDPLTGLLNRSAFDSLKELLKGPGHNIGLLLIDVDKFKDVNDTYGHQAGDATLQNVANLILANFRSEDYCIRLGGDEFAIIFSAHDSGMEQIIHEKMNNINNSLLHPKKDLPPVSLSVGGAITSVGFAENLYKEADLALYEVKESGRCGCRFYHAQTTGEDS